MEVSNLLVTTASTEMLNGTTLDVTCFPPLHVQKDTPKPVLFSNKSFHYITSLHGQLRDPHILGETLLCRKLTARGRDVEIGCGQMGSTLMGPLQK